MYKNTRNNNKKVRAILTLNIWDNLKKKDIIDMNVDDGDFHEGIASNFSHSLSSMNEINASFSREPLYCLNSPLVTLKIFRLGK